MQRHPPKTSAPASAFTIHSSEFRIQNSSAFTIIELIVVTVIMLILMSITLPAIRSMMRDNNQKQAVNLLTSLIANARATALRTHTPAGLVIYEPPVNSNQNTSQSYVQLVVATTTSPLDLISAPNSGPEPLPQGIKVSTLDDAVADGYFKSADTFEGITTTPFRMIYFDGSGQLALRSVFTSSDANASAWHVTTGTGSSVSSPGFIVFNATELKAAKDKGIVTTDVNLATWLQQNADLLIVNAYTGNVIRYAK